MTPPTQTQPAPDLQPVEVRYERTTGLPALLEHLLSGDRENWSGALHH